jgi:hypothetical protein
VTARRSSKAPLEKSITATIAKGLRARGCYVAKIHGGLYGTAGIPDLLVCWKGTFIGLEVKRPGGAGATPQQAAQLEGIKRAGGTSAVVRSFDEALAVLNAIDA